MPKASASTPEGPFPRDMTLDECTTLLQLGCLFCYNTNGGSLIYGPKGGGNTLRYCTGCGARFNPADEPIEGNAGQIIGEPSARSLAFVLTFVK
jgi:hypothetical protein